jgi:ubiquinone/menaquinone biosynthesis C-methylase UbiE
MMRRLNRRGLLLFVTLLIPGATCGQSQPPSDRIFAALAIREGSTVCEIGAGDGALTIEAARVVGPNGRVLSSELGDARLKALQRRVTESGLAQITVVPGDGSRTNFKDGECDAVLMKDVYHHFAEPAAMNASISASMRPGGRLVIIDFTPPPGSNAKTPADRDNDGSHGITPETLAAELKQAGFEPLSTETSGRWFITTALKPGR